MHPIQVGFPRVWMDGCIRPQGSFTRVFIEPTNTHREVQHAVLQHKVIGALDVLPFLQTGVVDAGVGEAARQVGAGQRLGGELGGGGGVTQLLHVLREEVGVAHVEGRHRGVERRHGDGGDLGAHCGRQWMNVIMQQAPAAVGGITVFSC